MTKIMILFAIVISLLLHWATTNVCRYNFAQNKKSKVIKIVSEEVKPSLGYTKVYYFKELNCNDVNFSLDLDRLIQNIKTISVMIHQELSTDILGNKN
tara:strand:- start:54 stop:347 length:294 start_codon:yes stop_codon:yes gene_type:complete